MGSGKKSSPNSPFPNHLASLFQIALSLLIALTLRSAVAQDSEDPTIWTPQDVLHPELPVLTHTQALSLCAALKTTRVPQKFQYLWAKLHPNQVEESEIQATPKFDNHDDKSDDQDGTESCYLWRSCIGTVRYPLTSTCGFFEVLRGSAEKCKKERIVKREIQGSSDQPAIVIDHARAYELCLIVNSASPDKQKQQSKSVAEYTPIRLDLQTESRPPSVLFCVSWKLPHCQDLDSKDCKDWQLSIEDHKSCKRLSNFYSPEKFNVTRHNSLYPDSSQLSIDFAEQNVDDIKEKDIAFTSLQIVSHLIRCQKGDENTTCSILPKSDLSRTKRDSAEQNPVQKVKRACCDRWGCGRCFYGSSRWSFLRAGRAVVCNCGINCPEICTHGYLFPPHQVVCGYPCNA